MYKLRSDNFNKDDEFDDDDDNDNDDDGDDGGGNGGGGGSSGGGGDDDDDDDDDGGGGNGGGGGSSGGGDNDNDDDGDDGGGNGGGGGSSGGGDDDDDDGGGGGGNGGDDDDDDDNDDDGDDGGGNGGGGGGNGGDDDDDDDTQKSKSCDISSIASEPRRGSVCLRCTENGRTTTSRWVSLSRKSAFGIAMTLNFDRWPWKPFQLFPFTWWLFMPSFIKPVQFYKYVASHEISVNRQRPDGGPDGRPAHAMPLAVCCWQQKHKNNFFTLH